MDFEIISDIESPETFATGIGKKEFKIKRYID